MDATNREDNAIVRRSLSTVLILCIATLPFAAAPDAHAQAVPRQATPGNPASPAMPEVTKRIEPIGQTAGLYTHPTRGFEIPIPPGTKAEERGESFFHIQARKGYLLSIQSANANPANSLRQMMSRLETSNLGPDKRWRSKLGERQTAIAGMPALESVFEGTSMRARVIIARGRRTDHVFIFQAPPDRYEDLTPDLAWLLDNFRPGPDDRSSETAAAPSARPRAMKAEPPRRTPKAAVPESVPAKPAAPTPQSQGLKRFQEANYGYAIDYPEGWVASPEGPYTVVFSGPPGSDAYRSTVSVQNIQPPAANSPADAASAVLDDIKKALGRTAIDLKFEAETPLYREDATGRLSGRQFLVSYTHGGERFRKWAIVMPRRSGNVAYIWSYTAPVSAFDRFRPLAEQMLDSWNIDGK